MWNWNDRNAIAEAINITQSIPENGEGWINKYTARKEVHSLV